MSDTIKTIPHFKFWCQKVLPLVYDDSLSYYELLCKVVEYLNGVISDINAVPDYIKDLLSDEVLADLLSELMDELREQIARANEGTNTTASANRSKDDLVWLDGKLVIMTRDILAGDRYIEDTGEVGVTGNFIYTSIEENIDDLEERLQPSISEIMGEIGDLDNLDTTDKTDLVTAINEVLTTLGTAVNNLNNTIGALESLNTVDKTSIVNAINEVITNCGSLDDLMTVEKSNLVGAINECYQFCGHVDNKAIELLAMIGDLSDLVTTDKTSIVNAINEVRNLNWDNPSGKVLTVGESGLFQTINDAIYFAVNLMGVSNLNPVTIKIFPGTYTENINIDVVHGLTFEGFGVDRTIIEYNGTYPTCVIRVHGDVVFRNLTIHGLNTGVYSVHVDPSTSAYEGVVWFDNCKIYGGCQAIGFGCGQNMELRVTNCILGGSASSLYVHNSPYNLPNQKFTLVDNILCYQGETVALDLDDAGYSNAQTTSVMSCLIKGNTSYGYGNASVRFRKNTNTPSVIKGHVPINDSNIVIGLNCRGNTITGFNYDTSYARYIFYAPVPANDDTAGHYVISVPTSPLIATMYNRTIVQVNRPGVGEVTNQFTIAYVDDHYVWLQTTNSGLAGVLLQFIVDLELA